MRALFRLFRMLGRDRTAATAVEYGFIVALVVIAVIASLQMLAQTTTEMWSNVSDKVQKAS